MDQRGPLGRVAAATVRALSLPFVLLKNVTCGKKERNGGCCEGIERVERREGRTWKGRG